MPEYGEPIEPTVGEDGTGDLEDGSQPADPQTFFVGGRERTVEEIIKGYEESTIEAAKLSERVQGLERVVSQKTVQQQANTSPAEFDPRTVPWRQKMLDSGVEESAVDAQARWFSEQLQERDQKAEQALSAMSERTSEIVAQQMTSMLETAQKLQANAATADEELAREFEGYDPQKLDSLIATNTDVKRMHDAVTGDPKLARRAAWQEAMNLGRVQKSVGRRASAAPTSRRGAGNPTPAQDAKEVERLARMASDGADADKIRLMRKLYGDSPAFQKIASTRRRQE